MTEQEEVVTDLSKSGVLAGMAWATESAYKATMQDYNPHTGHKPGWVGYTAHQLICDRMDRVFSCGDFHLPTGLPAGSGMEAVKEGLSDEDFRSMPRLEPGLVTFAPLNGSPGWLFGSRRWLLQSFQFGQSRKIRWATKSETKRRVASHPDPDPEPDLFSVADLELCAVQIPAPVLDAAIEERDIVTLVLAHSVHRELQERELWLGRPNLVKHQAWHWKHNLMTHPPEPGRGVPVNNDPQPYTPNPNERVSDAPVRLRKASEERNGNETSG